MGYTDDCSLQYLAQRLKSSHLKLGVLLKTMDRRILHILIPIALNKLTFILFFMHIKCQLK